MNQKDLAKEAGISQPALSDIETGETKMPEADTVVSIAQALKVRAEWIMTGKGPKDAEREYLVPPGDGLLQQLIDLYGLLSALQAIPCCPVPPEAGLGAPDRHRSL